ncbi:AAA family ATPase [Cellulosimicrobium sp. 72-3]|uniref:AAA family ATPase n=1 Tax=Cellulosimicrobium sp. 72-3 TaxID=2731680 RepID=UPI00148E97C1|nr:AAA family ATPase [Cellulosimicrobium sp. 72-3]
MNSPLRDRILSVADLDHLPDPTPLIADTLDLGTVGVLAGAPQTLKSFVLLDWAACVATGKPWQSRKVEQRRVLYIAGEGAHGINKRLRAWQTGWRTKIPADMFSLLPSPVALLNPTDLLELCGVVELDEYDLVIVDTLSKAIAGADENSAKDMSAAVQALYRIQDSTRTGTVLAAHHTGKDRSTVRGSSALEAGVDTVYATEGSAEAMTLKRTKRKDGPLDDVLELRFSSVEGTGSGIVERRAPVGISQAAEGLLSHISSHYEGVAFTRQQLVDTSGVPKSTVYRVVSDLVRCGEIVNIGTEQRPAYQKAAA